MNSGQRTAPRTALAQLHTAASCSGTSFWKDNSQRNSSQNWAKRQRRQQEATPEKMHMRAANIKAHERKWNYEAKDSTV